MNWNDVIRKGTRPCRGSAHEGQSGNGSGTGTGAEAAPTSWEYIRRPLARCLTGGDGGGLDRRLALGDRGPLAEADGPFCGRRVGTLRRDGALRMFSVDHVSSFVKGTRLRTARGMRRVEDLRPGDRVMTLDNGLTEVTWTGLRQVRAEGRFAPILVRPGALGNRYPITVSPSQHLVLKDSAVQMLFGRAEAVVAARHLLDGDRIVRSPRPQTEYVLLQMDGYQVLDEGDIGLECAEPLALWDMDATQLEAPLVARARAETVPVSLQRARGHRIGLTGYEGRMLRSMMAASAELIPGLGAGAVGATGYALTR